MNRRKDTMKLLECMVEWAKQVGIEIKQEEESIFFPVNGENGSWFARVSALEEDSIVFIVTAYPFQIEEKKRMETAAALGKITSQLKMGAFYIDLADGQINFRLSQKIGSTEEKGEWVSNFIMLAMSVTDSYYRKMMGFAAE